MSNLKRLNKAISHSSSESDHGVVLDCHRCFDFALESSVALGVLSKCSIVSILVMGLPYMTSALKREGTRLRNILNLETKCQRVCGRQSQKFVNVFYGIVLIDHLCARFVRRA